MIKEYRARFNSEYSPEKFREMMGIIQENAGFAPEFKISETPVFLPKEFFGKLTEACESIIAQIREMPESELQKAIPENCRVPNDGTQPHFIAIDFGICKNEGGELVPQLIELQAFPSLFGYQYFYRLAMNEVYPFTNDFHKFWTPEEYREVLRELIIGDENPENVVLLEIFPEKQKTRIDFVFTEKILGIKTVCLTRVKKRGKEIFYENEHGELVKIKRIYNRIIFDELLKIKDLKTEFNFCDDVDAEWITHPNWFFKISKFILPKLRHQYIPQSFYLSDFPENEELSNFVLKPLFSFAGQGVNLHPTKNDLEKISDRASWIMQRKVQFEPVFEDVNGEFSKAEIRMLYIWKDGEEPTFMTNLVRMTKSEFAGVDFNRKPEIWTGSSIAFFPKD